MYNKSDIRSIGELMCCEGGRYLTPVFGNMQQPLSVHVTSEEFNKVRGNKEATKDLAIEKLNK